jgi:hypothetical protein
MKRSLLTLFAVLTPPVLCVPANSAAQASIPSSVRNPQHGVRHVDPSSSVDLITQVNTLFADCAYACSVHIPAGNYMVAGGTILLHHASQSLTGDGKDKVRITYAGTNFLDWRYNASTYDFNASGEVSGFTVTCTNLAATCLTGGSTIGATWHDLNVYGPGGIVSAGATGTSQAFVFTNTYNWMERWTLRNINIGGFQTNLHFAAPQGGTSSDGYGTVDGVYTNQGRGSFGVVVDAGVAVYNSLMWRYQVNSGGTTGAEEYFHVAGQLQGVGFALTGENASAPVTAIHTLCGGSLRFEGDTNLFGGGLISDCPGAGWPAIFISPTAALNGVNGDVQGAGTVIGSNGKTQTVYPTQIMNGSNPYESSMTGFLGDAVDGWSAPFVAFDPGMSLCDFTRPEYAPLNALTWVRCVDGRGNETTQGSVSAPSITAGPGGFTEKLYTPASSSASCKPGQFADDANYHYVCTAPNTWKRVALSSF